MLKENLMSTVIKFLMSEIEYAVDNGFSQEILGGDIWIDTLDKSHSINLDIKWLEEPVKLTAVAYPVVKNKKGFLQEDMTAQEIIIYEGEKI